MEPTYNGPMEPWANIPELAADAGERKHAVARLFHGSAVRELTLHISKCPIGYHEGRIIEAKVTAVDLDDASEGGDVVFNSQSTRPADEARTREKRLIEWLRKLDELSAKLTESADDDDAPKSRMGKE